MTGGRTVTGRSRAPAAATDAGGVTTEAFRRTPRGRRDAGLDGVLVVDKPVGPSSHDVVALARRLAGTRRIGHGGTLDPFASGVLPLYLGVATRLAEFHLGATKAYHATVCFGAGSTTDDLEGELTPLAASGPSRSTVEAALAGFLGTREQVPPGFSAQRIGGRRAYALARRGQVPELPPRSVTFFDLRLIAWDESEPDRPVAEIEVVCSAGTYVRALARDLGAAAGSAAFLGALRRTAAGPFTLADAHSLDTIREAAASGSLPGMLLPVGAGLDGLPEITLDADEVAVVVHGGWIRPGARLDSLRPGTLAGTSTGARGAAMRLRGPDGALVAIGRVAEGRIVPDKVLARSGAEPTGAAAP